MTTNSALNVKETLGLVQDGFEHFNQKSAPKDSTLRVILTRKYFSFLYV